MKQIKQVECIVALNENPSALVIHRNEKKKFESIYLHNGKCAHENTYKTITQNADLILHYSKG